MIRVGVIGVGALGQHHARVYAELPEATLVGVHDRDPERAREVAARHGCRVFEQAEALAREVDAVSVAVPTEAHHAVADALLEAGGTRAIGPVLIEGHASLRDDFRISCPELDLVVDTAIASGALGARMTGGGFGGSAIVLVESADADTVTKAIQEAFAAADFTTPRVFVAVPSAGARRVS